MSKELTITVDAPPHSGSVGTSVLLKILLGKALPHAEIELEDTTGNTPEQLAEMENVVRQRLEASDFVAGLGEFFAVHGIKLRVIAKNHRVEA